LRKYGHYLPAGLSAFIGTHGYDNAFKSMRVSAVRYTLSALIRTNILVL